MKLRHALWILKTFDEARHYHSVSIFFILT